MRVRRGYSLRVSNADPPPVSSMAAGKPLRFGLSRTTSPYRGGFGRCAPCRPTGSPPKPSASGFGGERRRKEVNGAFRLKGGNGVHGLFDDAGTSRSDKGVPVNDAFPVYPYNGQLPHEPLCHLRCHLPLQGRLMFPLKGGTSRSDKGVNPPDTKCSYILSPHSVFFSTSVFSSACSASSPGSRAASRICRNSSRKSVMVGVKKPIP